MKNVIYKKLSCMSAILLSFGTCAFTTIADVNTISDQNQNRVPKAYSDSSATVNTGGQDASRSKDMGLVDSPLYSFYSPGTGLKVDLWKDVNSEIEQYLCDVQWVIKCPDFTDLEISKWNIQKPENTSEVGEDEFIPGYLISGMYIIAQPSRIILKECEQYLKGKGIAYANVVPLVPTRVELVSKTVPQIDFAGVFSSRKVSDDNPDAEVIFDYIMPLKVMLPEKEMENFAKLYKQGALDWVKRTTISFRPTQPLESLVQYDEQTQERFENELKKYSDDAKNISADDLRSVAEEVLLSEDVRYYIDPKVSEAVKEIVLDQLCKSDQISMDNVKSVLTNKIKLSATPRKGEKQYRTITSPIQFVHDHGAPVKVIAHTKIGDTTSVWRRFTEKQVTSKSEDKTERITFDLEDIVDLENKDKYQIVQDTVELKVWTVGEPKDYNAKIVEKTDKSITVELSVKPQAPLKGKIGEGRKYNQATVYVQPSCSLQRIVSENEDPMLGAQLQKTYEFENRREVYIPIRSSEGEMLESIEVVFKDDYKEVYSADLFLENSRTRLGVVGIESLNYGKAFAVRNFIWGLQPSNFD